MEIKYDELVKYKGKMFADKVYTAYKEGKIKKLSDLLEYYHIQNQVGRKKL